MKRLTKILALVLVLAAAMSLTSCLALDKAKENRMTASGNWDKIEFHGKTYKIFPASGSNTSFRLMFERELYSAATSDVPILLLRRFGSNAFYDKDLDIIQNGDLYFPEDKYDEYVKLFSNPVFSKIIGVKEEYRENGERKIVPVPLSDKASRAILDALEKGEKITGDTYDAVLYSGSYSAALYIATDDMKIVKENCINIINRNGEYFAEDPMSDLYRLPEDISKELYEFILSQNNSAYFDDVEFETESFSY